MIHVVGGTYREVCWEGAWDQLCGSGIRAAGTIASAGVDATLSSYAAADDFEAARAVASSYGIHAELHAATQTITFEYEHALATPTVAPPLHLITPADPIRVESKSVLRFGMLEGDALVTCGRGIYDPQSPYKPSLFRANGSKADELAIVCNRREATLLGGTTELDAAAKAIAERDHAAVVIIKQGTRGAIVYVDGTSHRIAAFHTPRVWPIGSGDIFSAIFAVSWVENSMTPVEAARHASLATAFYCDTQAIPTPDDLRSFAPPEVTAAVESSTIYLAGPFFNMMQRWVIRQARSALLDAGFRVFSPLHDVGYGVPEDIATQDLEALENASAVFAICDGLDSGTLFEIGYARKLGLPVVAFVQNETDESMTMVAGSGCQVVHDFASAVYRLAWALND